MLTLCCRSRRVVMANEELNGTDMVGELLGRLILASRVVMGQFWRNKLFLQAFHGGRDGGDIFGESLLISRTSVLYRVCKTLESNKSLRGNVGTAPRPFLALPWSNPVEKSTGCLRKASVADRTTRR